MMVSGPSLRRAALKSSPEQPNCPPCGGVENSRGLDRVAPVSTELRLPARTANDGMVLKSRPGGGCSIPHVARSLARVTNLQ